MPYHAGLGIVHEPRQAFQRRRPLFEQPSVELASEVVRVPLQHLESERVLAVEVVVKGALRHADTFQDRVDAGRAHALRCEDFHAAAQQRLARVSVLARDLRGAPSARSSCDVGHDSEFRPTVSK